VSEKSQRQSAATLQDPRYRQAMVTPEAENTRFCQGCGIAEGGAFMYPTYFSPDEVRP
jgi:hypothetical protein